MKEPNVSSEISKAIKTPKIELKSQSKTKLKKITKFIILFYIILTILIIILLYKIISLKKSTNKFNLSKSKKQKQSFRSRR